MEPIETIDTQALATVHGGFGAILGALLQAAPGIINSVTGLVSASRSGGGSGATQTASTQPQAPAASATAAASTTAAPTQMASVPAASACQCACNPIGGASVQNNVRIA